MVGRQAGRTGREGGREGQVQREEDAPVCLPARCIVWGVSPSSRERQAGWPCVWSIMLGGRVSEREGGPGRHGGE